MADTNYSPGSTQPSSSEIRPSTSEVSQDSSESVIAGRELLDIQRQRELLELLLPEEYPNIVFEPEVSRPGLWRYPTSLQHCCIYRVPKSLRDVKPEAYTPQLLIIGPLHHSLKEQASMSDFGDNKNTKFMGYLNMEQHKKIYLKSFSQRFRDENVINELKRVIEENEEMIRASYSESTTWIQSQEFVDMILHDSVFILEFILRISVINAKTCNKTGDVVIDELAILNTVREDLLLLENQLPYFILEKLFEPIFTKVFPELTFRELIIILVGCKLDEIKEGSKFKHFTDLLRCARVETLNFEEEEKVVEVGSIWRRKPIDNVEKLENAGVKFKALSNQKSLEVRFEKGCLKLPCFFVDDHVEMRLRNLVAFEQCHYPFQAHVCNFVMFLDHLIDTHRDVDILVEKGIIKNYIGYHGYVAEMVNKLCVGIEAHGFPYDHITTKVNAYCENPINRARAILKRVYFNNLWSGTATVAAVFLLLMTLIQTIASVMQVMQKK